MDVETHVTEGDMEDPKNALFFVFRFSFSFLALLILLAHFCFLIYLQVKLRQPICYLSSKFFFALRKVLFDMQIYVHCLSPTIVVVFLFFLDTPFASSLYKFIVVIVIYVCNELGKIELACDGSNG